MNPLARAAWSPVTDALLQRVERQADFGDLLATLQIPEPALARTHIGRALQHPDLAARRGSWLPDLLASARPGYAAATLVELADRLRSDSGQRLAPEQVPELPSVLGASNFLARLLLRHPPWVEELAGSPPAAPAPGEIEPDWTAIRVAKYRGLLRVVARDLAGRSFVESPRELSDLADRCLVAALCCAAREARAPAPALIALGKLGSRELNFSSDVDLMCVFECGPGAESASRRQAARVVRNLARHLGAASDDGFGYRVDLDLRPRGRQGPLASSVDATLEYYERWGADWERQMLIRRRHLAGPSCGRRFVREVEPFVYRRAIDQGAIRAIGEMKLRIEAERRSLGRDLDAELKEGPGGIRDVEFLVQSLQLLHGGREPRLRTGGLLSALEGLESGAFLPRGVAEDLRAAYLWLRRAEHALQWIEERQTHRLPSGPVDRLAVARRMGYWEPEGDRARRHFESDLTHFRDLVRTHFEALVLAADARLASDGGEGECR